MAWWDYKSRSDIKKARGGAWVSVGFSAMFILLAVFDHFVGSKDPDVTDTLARLILAALFLLNAMQIFGLSKAFERIVTLEETQRSGNQESGAQSDG